MRADAIQPGTIELAVARPPTAQEAVWLQIRTGALPHGAEIRVSTSEGVLLGTVSPYGVRAGQAGVLYTVPLPKTVIVNERVQLRLEIEEPGTPVRAPRQAEVESVDLVHVPISN